MICDAFTQGLVLHGQARTRPVGHLISVRLNAVYAPGARHGSCLWRSVSMACVPCQGIGFRRFVFRFSGASFLIQHFQASLRRPRLTPFLG
jgi:hypothetical protein